MLTEGFVCRGAAQGQLPRDYGIVRFCGLFVGGGGMVDETVRGAGGQGGGLVLDAAGWCGQSTKCRKDGITVPKIVSLAL